jgi:hypothetical protein
MITMKRPASTAALEAALREAARRGKEDVDLLAWADILEEQGREQAAGALRGLPGLAGALEEGVRRYARYRRGLHWLGDYDLRLYAASPTGGWGCGRYWAGRDDKDFALAVAKRYRQRGWKRLAGTHEAVNPLFENWDEVYLAMEWLARRLGRQVVQCRCAPFRSMVGSRRCDLSLGQRLRPPEPGRPVRMCLLALSAADD